MDRHDLYRDIAKRTQGDIYIGVVGPVRTGKSTFIKRFAEMMILPNMDNEHVRARVIDELPQSGAGKSIMTTQPKFIPSDAVAVRLDEHVHANIRLVDCVGYLVPGAIGHMEEEVPRMVTTPWFDHDIPFEEAAHIGTRKVICEHSTIGIVMVTDGSITDLPREAYLDAESKVIREVKATGKPFLTIVNSTDPQGEAAMRVIGELKERHQVDAVAIDVLHMTEPVLLNVLAQILYAFPLRLIALDIPPFMRALPPEHPLIQRLLLPLYAHKADLNCVKDYPLLLSDLRQLEQFESVELRDVCLGDGSVSISMKPENGVFYEVLSGECGCDIQDDYQLMSAIKEFVKAKTEYDRIAGALQQARQTGYGIVSPSMDEIELLDPEITRQGGRFGVRLHARASGLHLIRVDIDSEVNPIVGTEQQSEALVQYLTDTFSGDTNAIWETNLFGKSLYDLVCEGMQGKMSGMSDLVQRRMQTTLQRIVNNGCNGLICIML